jgi:hypothetical protein
MAPVDDAEGNGGGSCVAPSLGACPALGQAARPPNGGIKGDDAPLGGLFWPTLTVDDCGPHWAYDH